jgi:O-antigen/teichoic acid export membrane protein
LTGNVIGKGLALVAGIVVARFLGKDVYGEYGIIRNTILTIGIFSTYGLGYTATRYVAHYKQNKPELIKPFIKIADKITFYFSGGMALLMFLLANFVAEHWLDAPHLATALRILSLLIIFNAISTTQIGVLAGFGKFKKIAMINTAVGLLTFLFSVLLTYFYDLNGALIALLLVQILNCLFNYRVVKGVNCVPELRGEKCEDDQRDSVVFYSDCFEGSCIFHYILCSCYFYNQV